MKAQMFNRHVGVLLLCSVALYSGGLDAMAKDAPKSKSPLEQLSSEDMSHWYFYVFG